MVIKALKKEFEIKDIRYADRRKLHRLNVKTFSRKEIDFEFYYDLLEFALEVAFDDKEKALSDLTDVQIDELAQAVVVAYLNPKKKMNGSSD